MKLLSQFLGKRHWFAGDKVSGGADLRARSSLCPGSEFNAHSCFAFLQLTHVDFSTYDIVDLHHRLEPKCLDEFPNLKDFLDCFELILLDFSLFISLFSSPGCFLSLGAKN